MKSCMYIAIYEYTSKRRAIHPRHRHQMAPPSLCYPQNIIEPRLLHGPLRSIYTRDHPLIVAMIRVYLIVSYRKSMNNILILDEI